MTKQSAGILLFRRTNGIIEVLIAHPGGPRFENRDNGCWSIPKGEFTSEDPLEAAKRELLEETGATVLSDQLIDLGTVVQKSGKTVFAYAVEQDYDITNFSSNDFEMEWPKGSGNIGSFPEIDRIAWLPTDVAKEKLNEKQALFVDRLVEKLNGTL